MKYLWDTDTCVHFLNGTEEILRKTQSIGAENIHTTMVNIFELKFGAYNSTRPESNLERIEKLRRILAILDDFDDEIGTFFAKTKAQLRKKGVTVGDFDLIIAGFASVKNLCLVTNNIKHFKQIPDLKMENWVSE
jgi:tRNA(fMet)-specific endonuclease VapC